MKAHTKIYMDHFGFDISDFIPCEICGAPGGAVHHIDRRGMGGDPNGKKDVIENLMALCVKCHDEYGDKKIYKNYLAEIHEEKLMIR